MTETKRKTPDKDIATAVKAPLFTDGMIVTADDLNTAMHYPLDLMRSLNRAWFGCGIVCGLEVTEITDANSKKNFKLKIAKGTAMDCHGYPVQVPQDCELDLSPGACEEAETGKYYLAIARFSIPESPREDGDICESTGKPKIIYGRARETVKISVFSEKNPPRELCVHTPSLDANNNALNQCECLKHCTDTNCCAEEAWVALAYINMEDCKVTIEADWPRPYVKPIQCACAVGSDNGGDGPTPSVPGAGNGGPSTQVIKQIETSVAKLKADSAELEKKLTKTATDAAGKQFKTLETDIKQIEKNTAALEKKLTDKLKPAEIEKALDKKFKALEDKMTQLDSVAKEVKALTRQLEAEKSTDKLGETKTSGKAPTKSPPK